MEIHRLKNNLEVCMSFCIVILLTGSMTGSAVGSFPESDVSRSSIGRDGTGMKVLRLGKRTTRDVPMLRLGRASPSDDEVASALGSMPFGVRDQFLAILKELMEQQAARDETRRQPPLPRYGRRSVPLALSRRTSDSASDRASRIFPFDFSAEDDPVYRPPPRGGRYKRALAESISSGQLKSSGLPTVYFPGLLADGTPGNRRSVALPRFGRYLHEGEIGTRAKALQHPGLSSGTGNSQQAGSHSDPMADPREV